VVDPTGVLVFEAERTASALLRKRRDMQHTRYVDASPGTSRIPRYGQLGVGTTTPIRFECSQLAVDRLDPLVEPGNNPSVHVHQISAALPSPQICVRSGVMDPAKLSTCTISQQTIPRATGPLPTSSKPGTDSVRIP